MKSKSFSLIAITVITLLSFTTSTAFPAHIVKAIEQDRKSAPPGTLIVIRLSETIGSSRSNAGDIIQATLVNPVLNQGTEIFPAGTEVRGHVKSIQRPDRGDRNGELEIVFNRIIGKNGQKISIVANLEGASKFTESSTKRRLFSMAIAVGAGALVSKIFGGSVIRGLLIGSAAGTGYLLYSKGENITLPKGTTINLVLEEAVSVTYGFPDSKADPDKKYGEVDEAFEPASEAVPSEKMISGEMSNGPAVDILLKSGKTHKGNFSGISRDRKFLFMLKYGQFEIPLKDIVEVIFDSSVKIKVNDSANDTVLLKNGNVLSGSLMGFAQGKLVLGSEYGDLQIPIKDIAKLIMRK